MQQTKQHQQYQDQTIETIEDWPPDHQWTFHEPFNTLRFLLVHPKDKTKNHQKCGVIYKISCSDSDETCIGKTGRTLGCRMREHTSQREPTTAVGGHTSMKRHNIVHE